MEKLGFMGSLSIAVIVTTLTVILLPIPGIVLDILFSINILLAILVTISTLAIKKLKDIYLLPTILLLMVILEVIIVIAVTGVVIKKGNEFDGFLVNLIASRVSSNGVSGVISSLIFFLCFFSILIIFINKGMTKISEAACRFTLDRMPVKLKAIVAEFESKAITKREALIKKVAVQSESDFYGSLESASKFISGNIKILILAFVINIIGGILSGTMIRQEVMNEALVTYISLAIGFGFFVLIPSFIISITIWLAIGKLK